MRSAYTPIIWISTLFFCQRDWGVGDDFELRPREKGQASPTDLALKELWCWRSSQAVRR